MRIIPDRLAAGHYSFNIVATYNEESYVSEAISFDVEDLIKFTGGKTRQITLDENKKWTDSGKWTLTKNGAPFGVTTGFDYVSDDKDELKQKKCYNNY